MANRNVGIDLLRGICIVYIVGFWHMLNYTKAIPNYNNIITYRLTWIILGTFVLISGYFIGKNNIEIHKQALMSFYIKKMMRIYPLYLLAILIFTYLGLSDLTISIKAALLISMLLKPAPLTLWFITMIMFFYAISPLLIFACTKLKMIRIIICYLILSLLLIIYLYFTKSLDIRLIVYLPAFVLGIFIAVNDKQVINTKLMLIAFFNGVLISLFFNTPNQQINILTDTLLVTTSAYFIFELFSQMRFASTKLINFIILISYSSYCMYLFHRPIYMTIRKIYFPNSHYFQLLYLVAIGLPCIVIFSFCLQKLCDISNKMLTRRFQSDAQKSRTPLKRNVINN